ncbi:MAG: CHRD domain-containing protein [Chthoniobacterales bacterium]
MNISTKLLAISAALVLAGASAQAQVYTAVLNGANESPANISPGTGFATITLTLATHTLRVQVDFTGLSGTTSAAHIHAPTAVPGTGTANVATQTPSFSGFPLGVTAGTYDFTFDMSSSSTWNPAYVTANGGSVPATETAFASAVQNGTAYLNIHTNAFPGGEIRGFFAVPEPVSTLLLIGGVGVAIAAYRIRRR